jgi:hypothetical protein
MPRLRTVWTLIAQLSLIAATSLGPRAGLAEPLPVTGVLTVYVGSLPAITIEGAGMGDILSAGTNSWITRVQVDAGVFDATGITRTASVFPIAGLRVDVANGSGSFSRARVAGLHGFMPLAGIAKVCLFAACDQSPLANLSLPLSVIGHGGIVTRFGAVDLTVRGAPWTTGDIAIPIDTGGSFTVHGGIDRDGQRVQVNLVTPIFISSNLGASPVIASWASMALDFADECLDGADNDRDGKSDFADPGCSFPGDRDEHSPIACDDGIDNDGDALIDYTPYAPPSTYAVGRDLGCTSPLDTSEIEACSDGVDNDRDGRIDMADAGCADPRDNDEYALAACNDHADNDRDGTVDAADPGCEYPNDDDERGTAVCDDGVDQDGDAVADLSDDPGCTDLADTSEQRPSLACDDGDDEDGDGRVDAADPGCIGSLDPDERDSVTACDDGIDQDGDQLVDFPADPDCAAADDGVEGPDVAACENGLDDDGDGLSDGADPACAGSGDLEEAVLFADGALHTIDGSASLPAESLRVADDSGSVPTRVELVSGGVVGHRLHATQHSNVSIGGGTLGGDLFVGGQASVEMQGGSLSGTIRMQGSGRVLLQGGSVSGALELRDDARVWIVGLMSNRSPGLVSLLAGTITGTLADGSPVNLTYLREPNATIAIPEPESAMALAVASLAVAALARRRVRRRG